MVKEEKLPPIRVPKQVKVKIKRRAQANHRTIPAEALVLIEVGLRAVEAMQDGGAHA